MRRNEMIFWKDQAAIRIAAAIISKRNTISKSGEDYAMIASESYLLADALFLERDRVT